MQRQSNYPRSCAFLPSQLLLYLELLDSFLLSYFPLDQSSSIRLIIEHIMLSSNCFSKTEPTAYQHLSLSMKKINRKIQGLVNQYGGFDLIIGGSPCKNLSGNNRCSRFGLVGPASVTFFKFPRIVDEVRKYMAQRQRKR